MEFIKITGGLRRVPSGSKGTRGTISLAGGFFGGGLIFMGGGETTSRKPILGNQICFNHAAAGRQRSIRLG